MARVNGEAGWTKDVATEDSYRAFYLDKHHIKTGLDLRSPADTQESVDGGASDPGYFTYKAPFRHGLSIILK